METLPDGSTVIWIYDNETEFVPSEETDTTGVTHRDRENASRVIVNAAKTRWDYTGGGWHGGNDGSFYISTLNDWPAGTAPTLPGVVDALIGIFGSAGGAAVTGPEPKGAEILPVLDRGAIPGAAGFVIGKQGTKSVTHVMEGRKRRHRTTRRSWAAASSARSTTSRRPRASPTASAATRATRRSRSRASARGRSSSRWARSARPTAASRRSTRTPRPGAASTVSLPGGSALAYEHDGAPTTFSFELQSVERGASAAHFESGPLTIRKGERDHRQARGLAAAGQRAGQRAPRERHGHDAPDPQPRDEPGEDHRLQARRAQGGRSPRGEGHDPAAARRRRQRARRVAAPAAQRPHGRAQGLRRQGRAQRDADVHVRACRRACGPGPTGWRPTSWSRRRAPSRRPSAPRGGRSCGSQ